ncbi:MAG: tRNA (N6-threonylcarbamoyladenosine(37)-N6)-methyltransferase TrmO [Clostridia bacterium]|nr:tRNA (N6-threonylcarbamoyladenosine(37)-N6)-methyltransferase TrmO [Clostridia bacterium]
MTEGFTIYSIAHIRTDFKEKFGIPRQSGRVETLGKIVFAPEYRSPEALRGIERFSHLWLIFDFSLAHREGFSPTVRPPRLGGNTRVGVFASRSPFRPNAMGLSSVKLVAVEHSEKDGDCLIVSGADLLDGTPIYDIKPYLPFTDSHPDAVGGYADEHLDHRLEVVFPKELLERIPAEKRESAIGCLADDPRPSYQEDADRIYHMAFAENEISFTVCSNVLTVIDVT